MAGSPAQLELYKEAASLSEAEMSCKPHFRVVKLILPTRGVKGRHVLSLCPTAKCEGEVVPMQAAAPRESQHTAQGQQHDADGRRQGLISS